VAAVIPNPRRRVIAAVNATGRDGRVYTLMMRAGGEVVGRRVGVNQNGNPFHMFSVRRRVHSAFRDLETLTYIAELKGYTPQ